MPSIFQKATLLIVPFVPVSSSQDTLFCCVSASKPLIELQSSAAMVAGFSASMSMSCASASRALSTRSSGLSSDSAFAKHVLASAESFVAMCMASPRYALMVLLDWDPRSAVTSGLATHCVVCALGSESSASFSSLQKALTGVCSGLATAMLISLGADSGGSLRSLLESASARRLSRAGKWWVAAFLFWRSATAFAKTIARSGVSLVLLFATPLSAEVSAVARVPISLSSSVSTTAADGSAFGRAVASLLVALASSSSRFQTECLQASKYESPVTVYSCRAGSSMPFVTQVIRRLEPIGLPSSRKSIGLSTCMQRTCPISWKYFSMQTADGTSTAHLGRARSIALVRKAFVPDDGGYVASVTAPLSRPSGRVAGSR